MRFRSRDSLSGRNFLALSEVTTIILMVVVAVICASVVYAWALYLFSPRDGCTGDGITIGLKSTGLHVNYYTWEVEYVYGGSPKIPDIRIKLKSPDGPVKEFCDLDTVMIPTYREIEEEGYDLQLHYHFDEGSGSTVTDFTLNHNQGTITDAEWDTNSRGGTSLLFDGNGSVDVPPDETLDIPGPVSLEAWVYPTALDSPMTVIEGSGQYALMILPDGKVQFTDTHGHYVETDADVLTLNGWNHIAAVFNGSTGDRVTPDNAFIYVNGVSRGRFYNGTWSPTALGEVRIGQSFRGNIDEVMIYSRALSPEVVSYHAQIGNNIIFIDYDADGYLNQGDVIKVSTNIATVGDFVEVYVEGAKAGENQITLIMPV